MAFDNVTIFEVHLGELLGDDERERPEADQQTDADDDAGRRVPVKGILALTVVLAGAALAARKLRGSGGDDIETEPIEPGVEVETSEA